MRLLDSLYYHSGEPLPQPETFSQPRSQTQEETLEESQRNLIISVLEKTYWKVEGPNGGAVLLGLHPNTLRSRMKKLGITKPKFKPH